MGRFDQSKARLEALRNLWREGVDSGDGGPLDAEEIKRRGREARKMPDCQDRPARAES